MSDEEEEYNDTQVKDILEKIQAKKFGYGYNLREVLTGICAVLSRLEVSIELERQDVEEGLANALRRHRHLQDGTVVEEM